MLTYARELHPPARTRRRSSTPPCSSLNPADLCRQLSRWTNAGRLIQLRRGVYTLAPPYQKIKPHLFLIANRLLPASYVSLQSALDY